MTISIPPSWGMTARNAQAKISIRLARRLGAMQYFAPISFAMGHVTMMARVLLIIAAERKPDNRPMPYSAPRRLLIFFEMESTIHSTPP